MAYSAFMSRTVSYATLLALLAALAFVFPFVVRLAENTGVPRSYSIVFTLALSLVLGTYLWLRWRLRDEEADLYDTDVEPGVLPAEPYVPDFFFQDGVFQGEALLLKGHREAALKLYEAYYALLSRQGQDASHLDKTIKELQGLEEEKRASL